jgi:hypothetical protein
MDHINNDGYIERRRGIRGTYRTMKNILSGADGYQLLCANCHAIKTWHESGESNESCPVS